MSASALLRDGDARGLEDFLQSAGWSLGQSGRADGESLIGLAISSGALPLLEVVLHAGAPLDQPVVGEWSKTEVMRNHPLQFAVSRLRGEQETLASACEVLAQAGCCDRALAVCLWDALRDQDGFLQELLMGLGADLNEPVLGDGTTALHCESKRGDIETVKRLVAAGADVNSVSIFESTPIFVAAEKGNVPLVRLLLERGADCNLRENWGNSPLHVAILKGHHALVTVLLDAGAQVNSTNVHGYSPLHAACETGCLEVVVELLTHGADVNLKNKYGDVPMHKAANFGDPDVVQLLLDNGAEPVVANCHGTTPLFRSAWKGDVQCSELLLASAHLCQHKIPTARTLKVHPLFAACITQRWSMARLLIEGDILPTGLPIQDLLLLEKNREPRPCPDTETLFMDR